MNYWSGFSGKRWWEDAAGGSGRRHGQIRVNTARKWLSASINHVRCAQAGDFKCKRSTIFAARKGSADAVSEGVFPRCCNEFLICPQEKSKWKIGYPRLVFVVFYYMSHEPGFIWPTSCLLLFFASRQGEAGSLLLAAARLSVIFWLATKTEVICLLTCLRLPADAASRRSPAQPLFFSSLATVLIMHAFVPSGKKRRK